MTKVQVDYLEKGEEKRVVSLKKGETLVYVLVGKGPGEKEVIIKLEGKRASAKILGLLISAEGETSIKTLQHHLAPDTSSDLLVRSALWGKARFNYQGLIRIEPKAQGANAYQRNDNLLLSDGAKAETRPELEILANEVRCTHGATTGRINEDLLFYLSSRGLTPEEAVHLIVKGFLQEVLDQIPQGKFPQGKIKEGLNRFLAQALKPLIKSINEARPR